MVNNAHQRSTSPNFDSTNNTTSNRLIGNNFNNPNSFNQFSNSSNFAPDMGRRLERVVSAPLLHMQPKPCLRRKSCLHKSTPASVEVTDKNTDTDNCTNQKR